MASYNKLIILHYYKDNMQARIHYSHVVMQRRDSFSSYWKTVELLFLSAIKNHIPTNLLNRVLSNKMKNDHRMYPVHRSHQRHQQYYIKINEEQKILDALETDFSESETSERRERPESNSTKV